jgi:hypothetical protein
LFLSDLLYLIIHTPLHSFFYLLLSLYSFCDVTEVDYQSLWLVACNCTVSSHAA